MCAHTCTQCYMITCNKTWIHSIITTSMCIETVNSVLHCFSKLEKKGYRATQHTQTHASMNECTQARIHTKQSKASAAMLARSCLPSGPTLGHLRYSSAMPWVSTGLVIWRRLCHVSQVRVWASKVPPGPSPTLCETWTVGICFPR